MLYPTLEEVKKYQKDFKTVPVCKSVYSDAYTPVQVLRKLKAVSQHCYMLESVEDSRLGGRYTFLGYDPKLELTCKDGKVTIDTGVKLSFETDDPAKYIRQVLDEYRSPKIEGMPTFTGGLTGYFSYDYMKYQEPTLKLDAKDTEGFNDFDLMLGLIGTTPLDQKLPPMPSRSKISMAMQFLRSNSPHIGNPAPIRSELPTMKFVTSSRVGESGSPS